MTELQQKILEIVTANDKPIDLSDLVAALKQSGMKLTATQVRASAEEVPQLNVRSIGAGCRISIKDATQDKPKRGRPPKAAIEQPEPTHEIQPAVVTKKEPEMPKQVEPQQTQTDEAFARFLEQAAPTKPTLQSASKPKPITPQFFVGPTGLVIIEDGHKISRLSKSATKQLYQALHKQFAA